jgi:hypothetical protein
MTGYVIRSRDTGKYVAHPGSASSYTRDILNARRFRTREEAQAECCGNEYVVALADL